MTDMSYDSQAKLHRKIAELNNLRFEGRECDECGDSTVYQMNSIQGIDLIPTPSDRIVVRTMIENGGSIDITVACCGCGTDHDIEILNTEDDD